MGVDVVDLKEGANCSAASVPLGATATSTELAGCSEGPQPDMLPGNGSSSARQQQQPISDLSDSGGDDDILHKLTYAVETPDFIASHRRILKRNELNTHSNLHLFMDEAAEKGHRETVNNLSQFETLIREDGEEREYTGCFEGPEKTLEVCFKPGIGSQQGCRGLTRHSLDRMCSRAKCTILHQISNDYLDAYVLSESSLFVYPHKVVMKTCGTTTLLRCVATLLQAALQQQGLVLEWMGYSRKNFTFPSDQLFPHSSFEQELQYLREHNHLEQRLNGAGYVLGPVTGDHWFVYVADKCDRPDYTATDRTINMMMFDMHPDTAKHFYKEACPTGREMTKKTGIAELVPGAVVDDFAFDPCGYSMNAILYDSYYTIHVTPEESCSYASFETNNPFKSYRSIINNVLNVFRPKRWVLTMVADKAGLNTITENPFDVEKIDLPLRKAQYIRTSVCSTVVEGDCVCVMGAWDMRDRAVPSNEHLRGAGRPRTASMA